MIPDGVNSSNQRLYTLKEKWERPFTRKVIILLVLFLIGFGVLESKGFIVGEYTIARHKKIKTYLDDGYRSYYTISNQFIVLNSKLNNASDPLTNLEILRAQKDLLDIKEKLTTMHVPKEFQAFHMSLTNVVHTIELFSFQLEQSVTRNQSSTEEISRLISQWNVENGIAKNLLRQACADANITFIETENGFEYKYYTHDQTNVVPN